MSTANTNKKSRKRSVRTSVLVLAGLVCVFLVILGFRTYHIYQQDLPSFEKLHNIEPSLKTKIYSADGTLLQEYFSENRVLTPYSRIPKHMVDMLMAVEDREFMNHWGVHPRRIITAMFG